MRKSQNVAHFLLIFALSLTLAFPGLPVQALQETKTLNPIADSSVDAESPDWNRGREGWLLVRPIRQGVALTFGFLTYLMFDLSSIPSDASVEWAKLGLQTDGDTGKKGPVSVYYCSSNDWTEFEITYNNKPSFSETPLDTVNVTSVETRYTWNVTSTVQSTLRAADKRLSLVLKSETGGTVEFYSRQNPFNPGYYPELVVQYDAPPQKGISIPTELIIVIVGGAAAIVLTLVYVLRKGRRKPTPLPSPS